MLEQEVKYEFENKVHPIVFKNYWFGAPSEGYVVRNSDSFSIDDFNKNVAKFVRKNHVDKNDKFWMKKWNEEPIKNLMIQD